MEESHEAHSEDDKALPEKNKKRTVKTRTQVEALEKFYDEHKYPTESMKLQLAESLGLTEKQISGWFCHRRLKDKRLLNAEAHTPARQDRSSGVVQDRGSGHKQDSCGSTKQGGDKNFEPREVESGRLTGQEFSAADLTYERGSHYAGGHNFMDDASSGSSSSLRNAPSYHSGDPFDKETSKYLKPKFSVDVKSVKARPGPSGYLKVKGRVENAAITAVKRQLGRNYREDGPPLGVEFDPLPPGAFESSVQDPVKERHYGEPMLPLLPDVPKVHKQPNLRKGFQTNSYMGSHNSLMEEMSFGTSHGPDISESRFQQKLRPKNDLARNGDYFPGRDLSEDIPEYSAKDISPYESRENYRVKPRLGVEKMRVDSLSNHGHTHPYGGKLRGEQPETRFQLYKDIGPKVSQGGNIVSESSKFARSGIEYLEDKGLTRRVRKDGHSFGERRIMNENLEPVRVKIPSHNEMRATKRAKDELAHQQYMKKPSGGDVQPWMYQDSRSAAEMPSSFVRDDESAETSSSLD